WWVIEECITSPVGTSPAPFGAQCPVLADMAIHEREGEGISVLVHFTKAHAHVKAGRWGGTPGSGVSLPVMQIRGYLIWIFRWAQEDFEGTRTISPPVEGRVWIQAFVR